LKLTVYLKAIISPKTSTEFAVC